MFVALHKVIASIAVVTAAADVAVCQQAAEPRAVTVCELLSSPLAYSGLRVHVAGRLQGLLLFAAECSLDLYVNGQQWPLAILIAGDSPLASRLRVLQEEVDTPYGPGSNLMVELTGTFEGMRSDVGYGLGNRRNERTFAGRLSDVTIDSSRRERPRALSICEVLANPTRYDGRVISIEGEHRWKQGDQILYDAWCSPNGGAVLLAPPDRTDERPPPDTPLGVLRTIVELIGKGRFEAWRPGVEGFEGDRKGFGACGCYQGRLRFASFGYFKLRTAPAVGK